MCLNPIQSKRGVRNAKKPICFYKFRPKTNYFLSNLISIDQCKGKPLTHRQGLDDCQIIQKSLIRENNKKNNNLEIVNRKWVLGERSGVLISTKASQQIHWDVGGGGTECERIRKINESGKNETDTLLKKKRERKKEINIQEGKT